MPRAVETQWLQGKKAKSATHGSRASGGYDVRVTPRSCVRARGAHTPKPRGPPRGAHEKSQQTDAQLASHHSPAGECFI